MSSLPETFRDRILSTFGEGGKQWLNTLPVIVKKAGSNWSLKLLYPFKELSYSYVVPATRKGKDVVLKLSFPDGGIRKETVALKHFNGKGAVTLLDEDLDLGAILLERLSPGEAIVSIDDKQATSIAGQIMSQLHQYTTIPQGFPSVKDWAKGLESLRKRFEGTTGPFPSKLVEKAERVSKELIDSATRVTLLHGDLHHWNILSSQRAPWLAIDPKGVVGEPAYEAGAWLRNPFPDILKWDNPGKVLNRRIDQFSKEFGFDRERVIGWGMYQAVLAGWWSYEDNDPDWDKWIDIAEIIHSIE